MFQDVSRCSDGVSCIGEARDRTPSAIAARPSLLDREATVSATLDQQTRLCFGTRMTRAPFFDSDTLFNWSFRKTKTGLRQGWLELVLYAQVCMPQEHLSRPLWMGWDVNV